MMSRSIESQVSEGDDHLCSLYELGAPLSTYKVKPIVVYLMGGCSLLVIGVGMSIPLLILFSTLVERQRTSGDGTFPVFLVMYGFLSLLMVSTGFFLLLWELPRVQKQRVIVCDHGLLKITYTYRSKQVTVLYWQDILTIEKWYSRYEIIKRGYETFTLDIFYQHIGDMVALIKRLSGIREE